MKIEKLSSYLSIVLLLLWLAGCGKGKVIVIHASDSSEQLIRILEQPDPDSRNRNHLYAAKYLGKRRERSAVSVLVMTTANHSDERVIRQALVALGNIGDEHPDLRQEIARAITLLIYRFDTRETAERILSAWQG